MKKLHARLLEVRKEKEESAAKFEVAASYEMAYISLWSIVEKTLKDIDSWLRTQELYASVREWKLYLEGDIIKRPRDIKSFNLKESNKIPDISYIEKHLGKLPRVKAIMNTQAKHGSTKWRDRRNNIAHNAEPFGKLETYKEYREAILAGIEELVLTLNKRV